MAKIYYLRHQAAGVLTQFPFTSPPSDEQIAGVRAICDDAHGEHHPKEKLKAEEDGRKPEPYFLAVVEQTLLGPTDVPQFVTSITPTDRVSASSESGIRAPEMSARGFVKNP